MLLAVRMGELYRGAQHTYIKGMLLRQEVDEPKYKRTREWNT